MKEGSSQDVSTGARPSRPQQLRKFQCIKQSLSGLSPFQPAAAWKAARLSLLALVVLAILSACRSAKPPQPQPRSSTEATRSTAQAGKLMEARNWQSAATEWKKAVDEYFLVNDLTNAAVALHNLGQAERELTQYNEARKDLEQAAELNK